MHCTRHTWRYLDPAVGAAAAAAAAGGALEAQPLAQPAVQPCSPEALGVACAGEHRPELLAQGFLQPLPDKSPCACPPRLLSKANANSSGIWYCAQQGLHPTVQLRNYPSFLAASRKYTAKRKVFLMHADLGINVHCTTWRAPKQSRGPCS